MNRFAVTIVATLIGSTCLAADEYSLEIGDAQASLIQDAFVAAPISGVVADVFVSEGSRVSAGSHLAQLDPEQAQTELDAAMAAHEAAKLESENDVDLRYAQRTLEVRERELQQSIEANQNFAGAVSETEIEKLRLVVDQSRLAIDQALHEMVVGRARAREKLAAVKIAEATLRKHSINTTVNGYVTEVATEPGEWVEAGKPIVRVISLDPIRIECFVDGGIYGSELVGAAATFIPAGEAASADDVQSFTGRVTFVSPELHPVTSQARVWATITNPKHSIRAGMRGRLLILGSGRSAESAPQKSQAD